MARKGHEVTICTSKPGRWSRELSVWDADDTLLFQSHIANITDSLSEAVAQADWIWITMPAQMFDDIAQQLLPLVKPTQTIGVVPGSGGAEFAFREMIEKGCTFFGLQRVHSIARLKEYGHSVYMLGRKSELQVGTIPTCAADAVAHRLSQDFDMPCVALPNYLCVTLTPSNPILHTSRLYAMFSHWQPGQVYSHNILFYEEWTDTSSQMLFDCDEELQALCRTIPLPLEAVRSLRKHYESETVPAMTYKISHIPAFRGLTSPMKESGNGWEPDFSSRYFTADFSYGLKVLREVAALFCVPTPHMDTVWQWYATVSPDDAAAAFRLSLTQEEFLKLYQ